MRQSEAPVGTIATLGHPANQVLIVKSNQTDWRYLYDGSLVDPEDFRAGWDLAGDSATAFAIKEMLQRYRALD